MTTVQFDFAVDTQDGSYLGIYKTSPASLQAFGLARNGTVWDIDMQIGRADYAVDGAISSIRDGACVGYFQINVPGRPSQRHPVLKCLVKRTNASSIDRFRIQLGAPYIQG